MRNIPDSQQLFRLVDAEGDDINGEELGLLLYRGGTVCDLSWGSHAFEFETADVICRKMNFTRAISWTTGENFDIQSNYEIHATLNCHDTRCSYNIDVRNCEHSQDVFLSCTGIVIDYSIDCYEVVLTLGMHKYTMVN